MIQNFKYRRRRQALITVFILIITTNGLLILFLISSKDHTVEDRIPAGTIIAPAPVKDTLLFQMQYFKWLTDTVHKGYYEYDITD